MVEALGYIRMQSQTLMETLSTLHFDPCPKRRIGDAHHEHQLVATIVDSPRSYGCPKYEISIE
jgi:hypothetical protein